MCLLTLRDAETVEMLCIIFSDVGKNDEKEGNTSD